MCWLTHSFVVRVLFVCALCVFGYCRFACLFDRLACVVVLFVRLCGCVICRFYVWCWFVCVGLFACV